ncbi:PAS domain S-box protein [Calothrix sp. FACHB-1219]|uniref:PAS domain-containing sensor histidine kinase n=1 Tax=unclassified Calothrix TaxID=2619626 RepID=UPI0016828D07|nr:MULTISPECIES: PAS domain S-box protein [unclassified Calothrix]MBD2207273.1 PAS domain S-box protein [Calothrix sp. FACHB-168]MBD2216916.1 PAS domain S-box protein [Calothrix sp. FACHB-1219]
MKGTMLRLLPYAVAVLAVGSALLLTFLLKPLLSPTIFLLFFAAVAVSAWYGGMKPGLLATALATISVAYFFLEPISSPLIYSFDSLLRLILFVLVTTLISWLNSQLRSAKCRLEQSLQQLQASEARFRRLAESNIIGVVVADMKGAILEANDAFLTMLGYTREELLSGKMRWREMTPPEYQEISDRAITELRNQGFNQPFEKEYFRQDGSRVPILIGSALLASGVEEVISFVLDLSAIKQTENELRESQNRFHALADATVEGVLIHANGKVIDANPAFAKMFGYKIDEVIGINITEFLTPESRQLLQDNGETPYEVTGVTKEQNTINLEIIAKNSLYKGRNVRVSAWRNITERKQAEAAIRQREEQLRLITNALPVFISYVDNQQRYQFNNRHYEEWYGIKAAEFYGKKIQEIVGDSVYEEISDYIDTVLSGLRINYETQVDSPKMGKRDVNVTYIPQFNQQSEVEGFVALINDITETKQAQKALQDSEERFRKLTEKVRVIPWEVDANTGQFTYVGPQSEEILGYPATEWYATNFWEEHIHPEDREWAVEYCLQSALTLDNYEFEYRMLTADGRVLWIYDIVNVVRQGEKPQILHGFLIDITDRKLSEQERERLLIEAETANRMKDEFLGILSHELRTPLNAIVGWIQLLKKRKLDETTTTRALDTIDRNSKILAQLIEDVLDVSGIIQGQLSLNLRPLELIPVLEAALETLQPAVAAKEIHIESRFDPAVGLVMGDVNRLQQIFWNLLSNAVKFTPKGGRVEVQLERLDDRIQLRVSDTGGGIAPDFLPYVFERFRQADSSSTRSHGGLGLGLAIVRHLVELHGGTVEAQSQGIGKGATFIVNLPMKVISH